MLRVLLVAFAFTLVTLAVYSETSSGPIAAVAGTVAAAITALLTHLDRLLGLAKGYYELKQAKYEAEQRDSRIVRPSSADVDRFGKSHRPYDLLAGYVKEKQLLRPKRFVIRTEEERQAGPEEGNR